MLWQSIRASSLHPFNATSPVIASANTFDYDNASSPTHSVFYLPPVLRLFSLLCFRLPVSQTTMATLSTNNKDNIMSKPGLKVCYDITIVPGKRFLQVYNIWC